MPVLNIISKAANVVFFLLVVFTMIWMIAAAKKVNTEVILGSVIGYLLLGIIYSIFIAFIMQNDPAAFNVSLEDGKTGNEPVNTSVPLYFSFVTLATLGYGDVLPLKPYTRSLMTLITITGQFYIAIIVALLVGKFSSQTNTPGPKEED
jgi:amino acid transporter